MENMNKITDGRVSKSTRKQQHLILYFNYYRYFIKLNNMPVVLTSGMWEWWDQ